MLWVKWPEPGSLAGVEAMALGTPLVVSDMGCVGEYIVEGKTGTLQVESNKLGEAVQRVWNLNPQDSRDRYEAMFTDRIMGEKYEELYRRILDGESW